MTDSGIFVYVSNAGSREISVMRLDAENGDLTQVQNVSVTGKVMPMAVSPDRRYLYAVLRTEPYSVASFAVDQLSGKLTHLANTQMPESMPYICTDRTGRFLLGVVNPERKEKEPRSGQILVSPIGSQGIVQPPHQIVRTEPQTHGILPDPSNRYVFVTSLDWDLILRQIFDADTGRFSPNPLPPVRIKPKAGPRHFVFHPNNRFLYLINELDGTVYTFAYDISAGALNELQTISALPPDFGDQKALASDLHITPDGRFLYASERASSTLAIFKVDLVNGILTLVGNIPTEKAPRGFNIDPYGRYLLTVGRHSHSMTSYSINRETGNLTKLKQYGMGKDPNWIEIVRLR